MTQALAEQAARLYNNPNVSSDLNLAYQQKWLQAIAYLGPQWLLANHVQKRIK